MLMNVLSADFVCNCWCYEMKVVNFLPCFSISTLLNSTLIFLAAPAGSENGSLQA